MPASLDETAWRTDPRHAAFGHSRDGDGEMTTMEPASVQEGHEAEQLDILIQARKENELKLAARQAEKAAGAAAKEAAAAVQNEAAADEEAASTEAASVQTAAEHAAELEASERLLEEAKARGAAKMAAEKAGVDEYAADRSDESELVKRYRKETMLQWKQDMAALEDVNKALPPLYH